MYTLQYTATRGHTLKRTSRGLMCVAQCVALYYMYIYICIYINIYICSDTCTAVHCSMSHPLQHTATRSHTLTSTATRLNICLLHCDDTSARHCVAFPPTHSHTQPDSETHKAQFDVCSAVRCNALRHTYHCNTTHCTTHIESHLVRFRVWLRALQWYLFRNALQCVAFPATHWSETRC